MSISTCRRYRHGRALPISGLHPIPHEAPHPPHAGPRGQRAADHRDRPRRVRRGQPALRSDHRAQALPRARRRAHGDGARQRLAPAPALRAAGGADRRHGARRLRRARPARGDPDRQRRGGRAPAPRLRPHARAPGGRARPHGHRGAPGPGGRARAPGARPARRGQPGAHGRAAAPGGDRPGRAARPARRAARDAGRRHAGDGRARAPGPRAAPRRPRRPRPRRRPAHAGRRVRPARRPEDQR